MAELNVLRVAAKFAKIYSASRGAHMRFVGSLNAYKNRLCAHGGLNVLRTAAGFAEIVTANLWLSAKLKIASHDAGMLSAKQTHTEKLPVVYKENRPRPHPRGLAPKHPYAVRSHVH